MPFNDPGPMPEDPTSPPNAIEATRAAVRTLSPGEITDPDLARVGVTPEQFTALADADADRAVAEYHAERAESGAMMADELTCDQARVILARADTLERHAGSCQRDAAQCPTCAELDRDPGSFWDIQVPAAGRLLRDLAGHDSPAAAGVGCVEREGPDPWRPPAAESAGSIRPAGEPADAERADAAAVTSPDSPAVVGEHQAGHDAGHERGIGEATSRSAASPAEPADIDHVAVQAAIVRAGAAVLTLAEHNARAAALAAGHRPLGLRGSPAAEEVAVVDDSCLGGAL